MTCAGPNTDPDRNDRQNDDTARSADRSEYAGICDELQGWRKLEARPCDRNRSTVSSITARQWSAGGHCGAFDRKNRRPPPRGAQGNTGAFAGLENGTAGTSGSAARLRSVNRSVTVFAVARSATSEI